MLFRPEFFAGFLFTIAQGIDLEEGHYLQAHLVLPQWKRQEPDQPPIDQQGMEKIFAGCADVSSDHHLVMATLKLKLKRSGPGMAR